MATDKPRFTITVDPSMREQIENYQHKNRMKNQNQAVVALIEKGMGSIMAEFEATKKAPAPEGAEDEEKVQMVVQGLTRLLVEAGWIAPDADLTDAQFRTLASYVIGLSAYFNSDL